jgi:hypothetical protein
MSLANDAPTHPQKKKKVLSLAFGVCEKNKTHTHKYIHTQVVEKKTAFLHSIHLMDRSGQSGL